jgi:hypothetical protein
LCTKELASLSSTTDPPLFRLSTKEALVNFSFDGLFKELESKAPQLTQLLVSLCQYTTSGKYKAKKSQMVTVIVIASIHLKEKNIHMNTLQYLLSIILWSGMHATRTIKSCFSCRQASTDGRKDFKGTAAKLKTGMP